jgi:hypothetical protein
MPYRGTMVISHRGLIACSSSADRWTASSVPVMDALGPPIRQMSEIPSCFGGGIDSHNAGEETSCFDGAEYEAA